MTAFEESTSTSFTPSTVNNAARAVAAQLLQVIPVMSYVFITKLVGVVTWVFDTALSFVPQPLKTRKAENTITIHFFMIPLLR
jgi:hypothetical protein